MEILIIVPVLFLAYLVLSLVNSCICNDGHKWKSFDDVYYRCELCKKKRSKLLIKIWKR